MRRIHIFPRAVKLFSICFLISALTVPVFANRLNNRNRRTTLILSLALLALFSSTTVYTVIASLVQLEDILYEVIYAGLTLWVCQGIRIGDPTLSSFTVNQRLENCAPTAALTINV